MKIYSDKLNEADRLSLAALHFESGFYCKNQQGKERKTGYRYFIEFNSDGENKEVFIEAIRKDVV